MTAPRHPLTRGPGHESGVSKLYPSLQKRPRRGKDGGKSEERAAQPAYDRHGFQACLENVGMVGSDHRDSRPGRRGRGAHGVRGRYIADQRHHRRHGGGGRPRGQASPHPGRPGEPDGRPSLYVQTGRSARIGRAPAGDAGRAEGRSRTGRIGRGRHEADRRNGPTRRGGHPMPARAVAEAPSR